MRDSQLPRRLLAVAAVLAVVMATYLWWARPYQLRWGATDQEVQRSMPGDELDTNPTFVATRGITINDTPDKIWPWLIQMGYTRAGFYGYDILENLGSPRGMLSADHILPEFQDFNVGDALPLSAAGGLIFHAVEPNRYMIWSGESGLGDFAWALYPIDASHTRLISRIRWTHHWWQPGPLSMDLFTEFTDHLAVRKILQGVKGRVEGTIEPMSVGNIEFFIYLGSALVFLWALWSVLRLPLTRRTWLTGLAAGLAWLLSWYAPISIWIGAVLELIVVWAMRVEYRRVARAHRR
jgi:hypothetical protein